MEPNSPGPVKKLPGMSAGQDEDQRQITAEYQLSTGKRYKNFIAAVDTHKIENVRIEVVTMDTADSSHTKKIIEDKLTNIDAEYPGGTEGSKAPGESRVEGSGSIQKETLLLVEHGEALFDKMDTHKLAVPETPTPEGSLQEQDDRNLAFSDIDTAVIKNLTVTVTSSPPSPPVSSSSRTQIGIKRGTVVVLIAILLIVVLQGLTIGPTQFLGEQGWASVFSNSALQGNPNLLTTINRQIKHGVKPGSTATVKVQMTPDQYIDLIINRMTLDQKLGQMMIVQFTGATYSLQISTMINQYNVGAVLVFTANGNVVDKDQLKGLIKQMKAGSTTIPLAVAIDQEGGTVDRLAGLDGTRPAAATIGATNDANQARQAGIQDAKDLRGYGFNLNLAPVVDVTNVYNEQMDGRTFGDTPGQVTKMAGAYLQGLQKSGQVVGTLKHFPGLGDVSTDPHLGIPQLTRSKSDMERIDWAPYRALIKSGNVHAIMVTHEIVEALDTTEPSSLSPKVIQGILRKDLGFQGVVMTDSLTMDALTAYATESQAAVLSIEAGADLLMGASSPDDVAAMFQSIKQAMNSGAITQQRINESVHRVLMMKYAMGLLPIPKN